MSPADTTLFFFLSAVMQTFGAGFAILAAFAVYRLQLIRKDRMDQYGIIKKRSLATIGRCKHRETPSGEQIAIDSDMQEAYKDIWDAASAADRTTLAEKLGAAKKSELRSRWDDHDESRDIGTATAVIDNGLALEKRIVLLVKWGCGLTAVTVILALLLLVGARVIIAHWYLEIGAFTTVAGLAGATVWSFLLTAIVSLEDPHRLTGSAGTEDTEAETQNPDKTNTADVDKAEAKPTADARTKPTSSASSSDHVTCLVTS